jgi:hypothetical protein
MKLRFDIRVNAGDSRNERGSSCLARASILSEHIQAYHDELSFAVVAVLTHDVKYLEGGRKDEIWDDRLYDEYVACTIDRLATSGLNAHSQVYHDLRQHCCALRCKVARTAVEI